MAGKTFLIPLLAVVALVVLAMMAGQPRPAAGITEQQAIEIVAAELDRTNSTEWSGINLRELPRCSDPTTYPCVSVSREPGSINVIFLCGPLCGDGFGLDSQTGQIESILKS